MKIEIDGFPPSVNNCWRRSPHGHIYTTPIFKQYREQIAWLAKLKKQDYLGKTVRIFIGFKVKTRKERDIDNMVKVILDGLKETIITDDSWTYVRDLRIVPYLHSQSDKTIIEIEEYDGENYVNNHIC